MWCSFIHLLYSSYYVKFTLILIMKKPSTINILWQLSRINKIFSKIYFTLVRTFAGERYVYGLHLNWLYFEESFSRYKIFMKYKVRMKDINYFYLYHINLLNLGTFEQEFHNHFYILMNNRIVLIVHTLIQRYHFL